MLPIVSHETMNQSDNIVVLGSGPSLDPTKMIVKRWHQSMKAMVIGAHYKYFIPSQYTVFDTPGKFVDATNGGLRGVYIVGDRIKGKMVKKHRKRTMRIKYSPLYLDDWKENKFYIKSNIIPRSGAGWESVFIASLCRPKNLLIAGFDGYSISKDKFVIKHSTQSSVKYAARPRKRVQSINDPKKRKLYASRDKVRGKLVVMIFDYMIHELGINIYICNKSYFHGADKVKLKQIGVNILT